MKQKQHFLIIGGGLAGTFLAARLAMAGQKISLVDDAHPSGASRVAAGLFNVITGRFGAKSWMAESFLAEIQAFLNLPAFRTLKPHFRYIPIYRPFKTIEEYNKWTGRMENPEFTPFVEFMEQAVKPAQLINPLGGIMIKQCGWTDTAPLLNSMKEILHEQFDVRFLHRHIPYDQISLEKRALDLPDGPLQFDQLIFCEGHMGRDNPVFEGLPVIPNKGEILTIHAPGLDIRFALSKKIYLIPLGDSRFIVGSTYRNTFDDPLPSEEGKAEICRFLEKAITSPYELIDHRAGIRPTTPDRKPIIGTHPVHSFVHTFTGLGTKGILQAPYFSRMLSDYLCVSGKAILPAVNLSRFAKKL